MQEKPIQTWFHEARHIEKIHGDPQKLPEQEEWRKIKDRMKTVSVALVLALNIGVDPPDVAKPIPCARREAWVDPTLMNPAKVPQKIALMLQKSYERLQPRARYKAAIDPTIDYIKKLCAGMRRSAKEERVLFHFNGHGVPKPTEAGEIWVFNKHITQYIPVSIYDLQAWMGTPSVYVWDCHSAGTIVKNFMRFAKDHTTNWLNNPSNSGTKPPEFADCIQLAACEEGELLPTNPDLPADLFTSCLTTPIQTSMLWHVMKRNAQKKYSLHMIESIPGTLTDRRSVIGELNWIFTAITDTIAWNRLPRDTFQKLFRQDLLVASLFRSFLLAEKIMRDHGCKVVSNPVLPPVHDHPLWEYWEYTIELCLQNLYNREHKPLKALHFSHNDCYYQTSQKHSLLTEYHPPCLNEEFSYNEFFIEQLTAFDVWLRVDATHDKAPDQLPVVLQVLLSQVHRVRALELLAKFVDIGSWAVLEALFVGVFPYVLKLLQSGTRELRTSLAFIWAKILIVDPKCCEDLLNDDGFMYFIDILKDNSVMPRYKVIPAFVVATLMNHHGRVAQEKFYWATLLEFTMEVLSQEEVRRCKMLCVWLLISLGKLWNNFDKARWSAVRLTAYVDVAAYLQDEVPEVRAAAVYALGQLMRNKSVNNEHATNTNNYICDSLATACGWDGSVLVRLELVVAVQWFIIDYRTQFAELCLDLDKRVYDLQRVSDSTSLINGGSMANFATAMNSNDRRTISLGSHSSDGNGNGSLTNSTLSLVASLSGRLYTRENIYQQWKLLEKKALLNPFERIWVIALRLSFDPMSQVRDLAKRLVSYVTKQAEDIRRRIEEATLESPKVTFTVGSPMVHNDFADTVARNNHAIRPRTRNPSSGSDRNAMLGVLPPSSHFIPKRPMFGPKSRDSETQYTPIKDTDILEPVVQTEFFEWCGKIFNKQVYKLLYDEERAGARDWMVDGVTRSTRLIPSDWALHTYEGVEQHAEKDITKLQDGEGHIIPGFLNLNYDRTIYCLEWSYLRPYVYICDGRKVEAYNTLVKARNPQPSFQFTVNDDPLFEDPLSDVIVLNEKNYEILLMGTQDGLISIWDPTFNEHSHEILDKPKMLTSNHIFNDQTRIYSVQPAAGSKKFIRYSHDKNNHTLYRWDQNNGRLLCGGNVRIARIWDAWAEKTKLDISLDPKDGITSSVCADFDNELVCVGFQSGISTVYDVRITKKSSTIMRIRSETRSKVVGSSFLPTNLPSLVLGHEDGMIKIYDPRQFYEPLEVFPVSDCRVEQPRPVSSSFMSFGSTNNNSVKQLNYPVHMNKMIFQASNYLAACAMNDSTIRLFDLRPGENTRHRPLEYVLHPSATAPLLPSAISAMRFHSRRVHLAVATENNAFGIYNAS